MKTIKTIVLFSAIGFNSLLAQSLEIDKSNSDTLNRLDSKGNRQGKWVLYGGIKNSTGYGYIKKSEEGVYLDGNKNGIWMEYSDNGAFKSQTNYQKGIPNGTVILFNNNGVISESGNWLKDHWIGKYKAYYPNGNLKYEFIFNKKGKRCGTQKYYFENGNISKECNFNDGLEKGIYKDYFENGGVKTEVIYHHGKFVSVKSTHENVNYIGSASN